MLRCVVLLVVIFFVKKPTFISGESEIYNKNIRREYSYDLVDLLEYTVDDYFTSSLWVYKQTRTYKLNLELRNATCLLLILAGDIELCPGPSVCGSCLKNISSKRQNVQCFGCKQFFHKKCINVENINITHTCYCSLCYVNQDGGNVENQKLDWFACNRGLKFLHLNVNGLFNKIDQIRYLMNTTKRNIHLFGITETHLTELIPESLVSIMGYHTVRKDRKTGKGGGVAVFIRDDLKWQRRTDLENGIESIVIEIFLKKSKPLIICIMYRPPDSSLHSVQNFETHLNDFLTTSITEDKETILLGDLNVDYNKRNDHKPIKDMFTLVGLVQLIHDFTRVTHSSKTIIDVIFTSHQDHIKETIVIPMGISDHDVIGVNRKINNTRYTPRRIKMRNYKNYNAERLKDEIKTINWNEIIFRDSFNESWEAFKMKLSETINHHAPLAEKKIRGKSCPWLTNPIKTKIKERDNLLKKARKSNDMIDWKNFRSCRNTVTALIRKSKKHYHQQIFNENINDSQKFWKELKKLYPLKSKQSCSNVINIDGERITDKVKIADSFCDFFSSIGTKLSKSSISLVDRRWTFHNSKRLYLNNNIVSFNFKVVTTDLLLKHLRTLKTTKGAGPDEIPPRIIKDCADEIVLPLCYLINLSLRTHTFPSAEKVARVTPVFKSGEKSKMDNYRPISALNVFSKLIERIIHQQLYSYLEENKLLQDQQFGFRKQRSTQHAVSLFVEAIRKNADQGKCTGAIYLDLRKAFDTVNHSCLLHKLQLHGVHNTELHWFEDYLFNRTQYVIYDDVISSRQHIECGVPQGSILGPLLFILLVNDLHHTLQKSNLLMYADDTVVYYSSRSSEEVAIVLNTEIQKIADWMNENCLILNLKKGKTEFVLYGSQQNLRKQGTCNININAAPINEEHQYTYLGVNLDKHLTLQQHLNNTYKKVSSQLKLLTKIRYLLSSNIAETIYNAVILPKLLYCIPIMLSLPRSQETKLQSLHDRAFRICNGRRPWTSLSSIKQQRAACEVFKAVNGIGENYFEFKRINHGMNTRRNNSNIQLQRIRTEFARKSFSHQGGLTFNKLPSELQKEISLALFKRKIKNFMF